MRKILTVLLLVFSTVFFLASCASSAPAPEPVVQEPVPQPEPTPEPEPEPQPEPAPVQQPDVRRDVSGIVLDNAGSYTVRRGDTLSNIAKARYGADNGYYFPLIMMATENRIVDPDVIDPDASFVIPDLQANLADSEARAKMKAFFAVVAESYAGKTTPRASVLREELRNISRSL